MTAELAPQALPPISSLLQRAEGFILKNDLNYFLQTARLLVACMERHTELTPVEAQRIGNDLGRLAAAYKDLRKALRRDSHDNRELSMGTAMREALLCVDAAVAAEAATGGKIRFPYEQLLQALLTYTNPRSLDPRGPSISEAEMRLSNIPRPRALTIIHGVAVHSEIEEHYEVVNSALAFKLLNRVRLDALDAAEAEQVEATEEAYSARRDVYFKYAHSRDIGLDSEMVEGYILYLRQTGARDEAHLERLLALYNKTQMRAEPARETLTLFSAESVFVAAEKQLAEVFDDTSFNRRQEQLRSFDFQRLLQLLTSVLGGLKLHGDSSEIVLNTDQQRAFEGFATVVSNHAAELSFAGRDKIILEWIRDQWRKKFSELGKHTTELIAVLEKPKLSPQDAARVVRTGLTEVKSEPASINYADIACVDPRYGYLKGEIQPYAIPGGDVGFVMAVFGGFRAYTESVREAFSPRELFTDAMREQLWEQILKIMGGPQKFASHTDTHAGSSCPGCGHMMRAMQDAKAYGLDEKDMAFIVHKVQELHKLAESGHARTPENLPGKHAEQAVIIVRSHGHNLRPVSNNGGFGEVQVFRYTPDVAMKCMNDIMNGLADTVAHLAYKIKPTQSRRDALEVFDTAFLRVFADQLNATLQRLAKGLPMYEVTLDHTSAPKVNFIKQVI
ncbi:MAG: hypothetical protein WC775_04355 [Patescibacteria group bacterium]|jgi:hypothetical protein